MQIDNRKKIVFLGTPQVVGCVLEALLQKSRFFAKVILVVSQPPARSSRSKELLPSAIQQLAHEKGVPVLTPVTAKDPQFISDIAALEPELCVTAAYGNYLPSAFLSIPKFGTVNIHPSLLPRYRGAAPVQRTLENGDETSGVSLLYSVKEMDAGPLLAQQVVTLDPNIKAPALLEELFKLGADLLVKTLPAIFSQTVVSKEQAIENVTYAKKIEPAESFLDFNLSANAIHNKVRAFAGWPGTKFVLEIDGSCLECKIMTTQLGDEQYLKPSELRFNSEAIEVGCGDGRVLRILEIQPLGKKSMSAKDFINGIKNKTVKISCK